MSPNLCPQAIWRGSLDALCANRVWQYADMHQGVNGFNTVMNKLGFNHAHDTVRESLAPEHAYVRIHHGE